ncbi:MAG: alpha/beta hydrolase [Planctomycetota bacterium]|nr:MAG: alpha/beta hydrolase [Planctomycetota bacterium]
MGARGAAAGGLHGPPHDGAGGRRTDPRAGGGLGRPRSGLLGVSPARGPSGGAGAAGVAAPLGARRAAVRAAQRAAGGVALPPQPARRGDPVDASEGDAAVTLWIGLHGNPGRGRDLEALLAPLRSDRSAVELPTRPVGGASLRLLLGEIERLVAEHDAGAPVLVGYSWGAWLALQYVAQRPVAGLVLVSPYLVVERPGAPPVVWLLRAPVLGRLLLRRVARGAQRYLEQEFAPGTPPPGVRAQRLAWLSEPTVWRGAAIYKVLQQRHPLPPLARRRAPSLVVRGACDAVADWQRQRAPIVAWIEAGSLSEQVIEQAGHALPWTHNDSLRAAIVSWWRTAATTGAGPVSDR